MHRSSQLTRQTRLQCQFWTRSRFYGPAQLWILVAPDTAWSNGRGERPWGSRPSGRAHRCSSTQASRLGRETAEGRLRSSRACQVYPTGMSNWGRWRRRSILRGQRLPLMHPLIEYRCRGQRKRCHRSQREDKEPRIWLNRYQAPSSSQSWARRSHLKPNGPSHRARKRGTRSGKFRNCSAFDRDPTQKSAQSAVNTTDSNAIDFWLTFWPISSKVWMLAARNEVFWTPPMLSSVMKIIIWMKLSQKSAEKIVNLGQSIKWSD